MNDDATTWLREYAQTGSEKAFAALVSLHINLVYSVAIRQVRNPQLAEEVTQAVFIILARKAKSLGAKAILSSWLCQTARYVSASALRTERRRQLHEQEVRMQSTLETPEADAWTQVAPHLDEALSCLPQKEHSAIVLRFLEGKDLKAVGAMMGTSEDAARMRINRGIEKMRRFFARKGVTLPTSAIFGAVSAYSVQAAPAALAKSVAAVAITKAAVVSGSTLTLAEGAMKLMAWTKVQWAVVGGGSALLMAGVAGVTLLGIPDLAFRSQDLNAAEENISAQNVSATEIADTSPAVSVVKARTPAQPKTPFSSVYSADFTQFAANLRAVSCPEATIKDILTAAIHDHYSSREEALRPTPADHVPLTWPASTSERKLVLRRLEAAALAREQSAVLSAALGYTVSIAPPEYALWDSDKQFERVIAAFTPEQQAAARQAHEDYWQKVLQLHDRTKGLWQAADLAELAQLKAQRQQALLATLNQR